MYKKLDFKYVGENNIQWVVNLDSNNILTVECCDETREYQLDNIVKHKIKDNYFFLYMKDNSFYQFKFEDDLFLVGDLFDFNDDHIESIANYVFSYDE